MSLAQRRRMIAHATEEALYLAASDATYIILPVTPNDNPIIEAECYIARTDMAGTGSYISVLGIGANTSPGFYIKTWSQINFEPRSWSGGSLQYCRPPLIAYKVDYPAKTFSATRLVGTTVNGTFSGNTTNANTFRLRLNDKFMYKRLKITVGGRLSFDFVAATDGSGTPCLKDVLTGNYYYDANGTGLLTPLPE